MTHRIEERQVYVAASPKSNAILQVTAYDGGAYVDIVDTGSGRQSRILAEHLHATWQTHTGDPRRGGYVLDETATANAEERWLASGPDWADDDEDQPSEYEKQLVIDEGRADAALRGRP